MKPEDPAICADCGHTIEHAIGHASRCDSVVQRLRERYHEARALVSAEESDPIHRGQLDWILGVHGDDARSAAGLDARTSELVVLWLEDLIRHLEELPVGEALPSGEPDSVASRTHRAASALHTATREFADTFLRAADAEFLP